jgi:hypothetical protein
MAVGRYHWSNAAHSARFFVIDAVACVPMLALILHPSWLGLYILLITVAFLFWVERIRKMSLAAFFRSINIVLTGRVKSSLNIFKEISR